MDDAIKLVVNDLLCYAVNKLGRSACRPLKGTIVDFYEPSDISLAKDLLLEHCDLILDKSVKIPRRRKESVGRVTAEIDDIFTILTNLDEKHILDKLPMFVSTDPDKMPSIKLSEGDMGAVFLKLSKLEIEIVAMKQSIADNACKSGSSWQHSNANTIQESETCQKTSAANHFRVDKPHAPLLSDSEDCTEGGTASDNPWREQTSRSKKHGRKRVKYSNSPGANVVASAVSYASKASSSVDKESSQLRHSPNRQHDNSKKMYKKAVIGNSDTCSLRASKTLMVPKAVYHVANIDEGCSEAQIKEHIISMGVRILTCFELPRRERQPLDEKSFRICIIAADKEKFLDTSKWTVGISIRPWVRKPNKDAVINEQDSASGLQANDAAISLETVPLVQRDNQLIGNVGSSTVAVPMT